MDARIGSFLFLKEVNVRIGESCKFGINLLLGGTGFSAQQVAQILDLFFVSSFVDIDGVLCYFNILLQRNNVIKILPQKSKLIFKASHLSLAGNSSDIRNVKHKNNCVVFTKLYHLRGLFPD